MTTENANSFAELDASRPAGNEQVSVSDDQHRQTKRLIQEHFPNFGPAPPLAVTLTPAEINSSYRPGNEPPSVALTTPKPKIIVITATGQTNYTPTNAKVAWIRVRLQAPGGSGAKGNNGGAGGGGAYAEVVYESVASATVDLGAPGAGQTANNTNGNDGGDSSFDDGGSNAVTCGGGKGGINQGNGGAGGTVSGTFDLGIDGQQGGDDTQRVGGASFSGAGSAGINNASSSSPHAPMTGAGSGGTADLEDTKDGGGGYCIIEEHFEIGSLGENEP